MTTKRKIGPTILAGFFAVLLIGGGTTAWQMLHDRGVPDVVGMTLDDAIDTLAEDGWIIDGVEERRIGNKDGGTVLQQDPVAKGETPNEKLMNIVVEATSVEVPALVGLGVVEAERVLVDAGLAVGEIAQTINNSAAGGTVVTQSPGAAQRALQGASVKLGVVERTLVTVPSVTGHTVAAARDILQQAELRVGSITEAIRSGWPGRVISHDPWIGLKVAPGTQVKLTVQKSSFSMPNVIGITKQDALAQLRELGLNPQVNYDYKSKKPSGTLIRQSPAAKRKVSASSAVDVTIASKFRMPCNISNRDLAKMMTAQLGRATIPGATGDAVATSKKRLINGRIVEPEDNGE